MGFVKILENLEPVFISAGELACAMQKSARQYNKYNSGNPLTDIVTEADLAVQELILQAMVKTDLVNCRLMAEEDTPLVKEFNQKGQYYLAIDPIDDTAIYASGGAYFNQVISLHDGKNFLYMYVQLPALKWVHKVVNNVYSSSGDAPNFSLPKEAKKTIVYWQGNPEQRIPQEFQAELKSKGLRFAQIKTISPDVGSIAMFVTNRVAGVYQDDMNVYDALTEYNIGLARGQKVYSDGPNGKVDLLNIQKRQIGLYYPGYCLALNTSVQD